MLANLHLRWKVNRFEMWLILDGVLKLSLTGMAVGLKKSKVSDASLRPNVPFETIIQEPIF